MKKASSYLSTGEIEKITVKLYDANLTVKSYQGVQVKVEFNGAAKSVFKEQNGELIILQKKPIFIGKLRKPCYTVFIPESIVPDLNITATYAYVDVRDGIFKEIKYFSESGKFYTHYCYFDGGNISGIDTEINLYDSTFKSPLTINGVSGDVYTENCYFKCIDVNVQFSSIGSANLHCPTCFLRTEQGNVTARLVGCKEDFSINIKDRHGENLTSDGENKLVIYAPEGTAVTEFTTEFKEAEL
ncbi:MAG: DUF4097 family beta strand repeat protein [Clostridia bacterium]|nr:DUF4097 family beta strand repeat protein [Clostridia bacterium]